MNRSITHAELRALKALHLWLHQGTENDCDLIEECAEFHEEWDGQGACAEVVGKRGVE